MSRSVDADVVLAALDLIDDVLSDRSVMPSTRISVARRRVVTLRQQIENQASPTEQNWRLAWAPQEGSTMTWVVQESGEAFVVAVRNEWGETVKVHPIPFTSETEAKRAAARLNERDARGS